MLLELNGRIRATCRDTGGIICALANADIRVSHVNSLLKYIIGRARYLHFILARIVRFVELKIYRIREKSRLSLRKIITYRI